MKTLRSLLRPIVLATVWLAFAAGTAFALTPPSNGTLAAEYSHTVVVKSDGTVWAWGLNDYGQLGDGTKVNRSGPVPVTGLSGVVAVVTGVSHTAALKGDGTVWTCGKNNFGQLGNGASSDSITPVQVNGLSDVVAIAAGSLHTVAVKSDGTVWAWGGNLFGQLGDGTTTSHNLAVRVSGLSDVVAVAAGYDHTVALKRDGTVWAWGYNNSGQLGDGTTTLHRSAAQVIGLTGVWAIAAGEATTLSLKADGSVWGWGANSWGQLGDGTTTMRTTPVAVRELSGVVALSAGPSSALALKADGSVWAWGANFDGGLGDGTTTNRTMPVLANVPSGVVAVAAGSGRGTVLTNDGAVWAWGQNRCGQLGDGTAVGRMTPVQVSPLKDVLLVEGGDEHSVAVTSDGTLWTWGYNADGELGDGTKTSRPTPKPVVGLSGIVTATADLYHTVAVRNDGTVWAWGRNTEGELGDGTVISRTTPAPVSGLSGVIAVAAGYLHTVALKNDGTVWSWGYNFSGQLGDGTTTLRTTPVQVTGLAGIIAVAAGDDFTFAVKSDGTLWAWGSNYYGQLGDGTITSRSRPVRVSALNGVVAVAAGEGHTVALKSDGTVWAWGYNNYGQLGNGTAFSGGSSIPTNALSGAVAVEAGDYHTVALKSDGTVWAWGCNTYGQLGDGTTTQRTRAVQTSGLSDVVAISAGCYFTVALKSDRSIRGWGDNSYGQLGFSSGRLTQAAIRLIPWADDTDQDGMGDAWETQYFGDLNHRGGTDTDSDGLTDIQEFARGADPTQADIDADGLTDLIDAYPGEFYNAITPSVTVVGGDNQVAAADAFNAQPLDVAVWNAAATAPLVNAPVVFSVSSGEGSLAANLDGSLVPSLALRTDQDGTAQVYFKHGSTSGGTSEITVSAGNAALLTHTTTSKQDQTITFADPGPQSFGVPLTLDAAASSGLPVRFEVTSGPVAIADGIATFTGAGSVTITAKQDGNSAYDAAPNVARTFIVNLGSQTTVSVSPSTASIGVGDTVTFTASGGANSYVWGGRASGTGSVQTATFSSVGTFDVTVYAQADGRYAQSNTATAIVAVTDTAAPVIEAPENLIVEATGADGAVATFEPSATDFVDGIVAVSASPSSGSTFPLGTTTVALAATDAAGNRATKTFTVTVRDTTAPTLAVPANFALGATDQNGAIVTYSASATDLVDGSVEVVASNLSGSVFPIGTTKVTLTANDAAGNSATGSFAVVVEAISPSITNPPLSQVVAVGSSITFSVGAAGTKPYTYSWKFGRTTIVGANDSSYTIPSVQACNAGSYSVVVSNAAGSVTSSSATLSVKTPPAIKTQPTNATVVAGKNATFKVVATGSATLTYQWYFNGSLIPGARAATYTVATAQPTDGGNYSVIVANAVGSVASIGATLKVNSPVVITSQPASQSITRGSTVTFAVEVAGTAPFTYQWRRNNVAIAGATSSEYTIPAAQTANAGNYTVVVTNVAGSLTSSTAVLKVNVPPAITTQPMSKSVTSGTAVTFKVVATGTATLSYLWKLNNVVINGATTASYSTVASIATAGTYSVVVSNAAGSATSSAAMLTLR